MAVDKGIEIPGVQFQYQDNKYISAVKTFAYEGGQSWTIFSHHKKIFCLFFVKNHQFRLVSKTSMFLQYVHSRDSAHMEKRSVLRNITRVLSMKSIDGHVCWPRKTNFHFPFSVYIHLYIYTYIYIHYILKDSIYMDINIDMYININMYIYISLCLCICLYILYSDGQSNSLFMIRYQFFTLTVPLQLLVTDILNLTKQLLFTMKK